MAHEAELAAVPLFSQLPRKDLTRISRAVVERNYKKGETILIAMCNFAGTPSAKGTFTYTYK